MVSRVITKLYYVIFPAFNPSTGSPILLHQREAGVILTPWILRCILLVLSGVLNANHLLSFRTGASTIILLSSAPGDIAIRHVCLFVRLCVRAHVLGPNILKTVADSHSVTMKRLLEIVPGASNGHVPDEVT